MYSFKFGGEGDSNIDISSDDDLAVLLVSGESLVCFCLFCTVSNFSLITSTLTLSMIDNLLDLLHVDGISRITMS